MRKTALILLIGFWSTSSYAGPQVGTLTGVEGSVQIYSHPSASGLEGPSPHVKYEGIYYSVVDGKIGDRVEKGNILRTRPGAKALIIFDNGDQYHIAPATAFRVDWDHDAAISHPEMELRYGKIRFVIAKGGPRSNFHVRSRAATLGVRGTDFFVAVDDDVMETATLRGAVEVQPLAAPQQPGVPPAAAPKAEIVAAGQTASATPAQPVELHKITQDELRSVARNTEIHPEAPAASTPPEVVEKIHELEAAAATSTLKDIKIATPALAAKLEPTQPEVSTLNRAVVADLEPKADTEKRPVGPIADVGLEKGESNAAAEKKEVVEEAPHMLPSHKLWVGIRGGTGPTHADVGSGSTVSGNLGPNPCTNCANSAYNDGSRNGGQLTLQAQYELSSQFSVLGEYLPIVGDGAEGQFGPMSNCQGSGPCNGFNMFDEIDLRSMRLNAWAKWNPSLFGSQGFGLDLGVGPGINFLLSAKYPHYGSNGSGMDISSSFNTVALMLSGSIGLHERLGDNFKILVDYRFTHGLTNMVNSSGVFLEGSSFRIEENSVGLALQYGF